MQNNIEFNDNICLYNTKKYKTISLYFNYACEYDDKTYIVFKLLSLLLGSYSNKYQTKQAMTKIKDMLYGASFSCNVKPLSNLILFSFKYTFINPKYLKDVALNDYIDFFNEVFNHPLINQELLNEYKKEYKESVLRLLDKPHIYAKNETLKILGKEDKIFSNYVFDDLTLLDNITVDDLNTYMQFIKEKCSLKIFYIGEINDELVEYLKQYNSNNNVHIINSSYNIKELGIIDETKDVSQSCLNIVYNTPYNYKSNDYYTFILGNILFGIVPTSLLFEEIREKLSLCYQIAAIDYRNEGIVRVTTLFDKDNKDLIIEQVDKQIQRLIDKDYDPLKLDMARSIYIDNLYSIYDDNDSLVNNIYVLLLNDIYMPIDDFVNNLNKVTIEDISNAFRNYKKILVHSLIGVKNEKDS